MKLFALLATSCFADFKLKIQLCSDGEQDNNIVKAAFGGTKGSDLKKELRL